MPSFLNHGGQRFSEVPGLLWRALGVHGIEVVLVLATIGQVAEP